MTDFYNESYQVYLLHLQNKLFNFLVNVCLLSSYTGSELDDDSGCWRHPINELEYYAT